MASDLSKIRYTDLFSTPLVTHVLQDAAELNLELRKCIMAQKEKTAGLSKSNYGGWHSETGQLEFCGNAGQTLIGRICSLGNDATRRIASGSERSIHWTVSAWANVNRKGDFNKIHVHPGSTWSGAYYVHTGADEGGNEATMLQLIDPCPARATTFLPKLLDESVHVHPKPGLMVLFPSYVPHMVFPHGGATERISIGFNLRAEPFP